MKTIYEVTTYARLNGEKDTHCLNFWRVLRYGELPIETVEIISDFQTALQHEMLKAEETLFGHKQRLVIPNYYNDSLIDCTVKEKQFKSLELITVYTPYSTTMAVLAKMLPSADFVEYLRDNGIGKLPQDIF